MTINTVIVYCRQFLKSLIKINFVYREFLRISNYPQTDSYLFFFEDLVEVILVAKRNNDEVYKKLERL